MTPSDPPTPQSLQSGRTLLETLATVVTIVMTLGGAIAYFHSDLKDDYTDKIDGLKTDISGDISELKTDISGDISELKTDISGDISELKTDISGDISELKTAISGDISELKTAITRLDGKVADTTERVARLEGRFDRFDNEVIAALQETPAPSEPTSGIAASPENVEGTNGNIARVQEPFGAGWKDGYGAFGNIDIKIASLSDAQNLGWFGWTSDTNSNFELVQKTILAAFEAKGINTNNTTSFETPAPTVTFQGWTPSQPANKNLPKITEGTAEGIVYIPPPFGAPQAYEKFADIKISSQDDAQKLGWFGWTSDTDSNFELTQKTIRAALESEGIDISNPLWFETPGPMAMNQDWILIQPAM